MVDLAYVIPAYNAVDTVAATVRSVLAQRGPRIMAIVVDDGSTDATADAARGERDWRVEVVRQANRGLAGARNTGLEVLEDRAQAVCFLDADDIVEPGHAAALCAGLGGGFSNRTKPRDLAACGYRMLGPDLSDLGWTIDIAPADARWDRLLEFNPFAVGGVAVRIDSLRDHAGPRPFDESLAVHEDWDLWLRLTVAGCSWGEMVREHLFGYRMRAGSLSRGVERMYRVGRRVIERAIASGGSNGAGPALAGAADQLRHDTLRRWTVRHLARAAVADPGLITELVTDLDRLGGRALTDPDRPAFLGSLRHALMLEYAVGPGAAMGFEDAWKAAARGALHPWPECHALLDTLSFNSWEGIADRLARLLRRDGRGQRGRLAHLRPVVAGMGRNGRALAAALGSRAIAFDWLDEDPAAECPVRAARRLAISQVAPKHLVIVTPASADGLIERLQEMRALVMRPGDLVESGHESHRRVA